MKKIAHNMQKIAHNMQKIAHIMQKIANIIWYRFKDSYLYNISGFSSDFLSVIPRFVLFYCYRPMYLLCTSEECRYNYPDMCM